MGRLSRGISGAQLSGSRALLPCTKKALEEINSWGGGGGGYRENAEENVFEGKISR